MKKNELYFRLSRGDGREGMECEYTTVPVVACDEYNVYICRGDTVTSSDIGESVIGSVPWTIVKFVRRDKQYYFLTTEGSLWSGGQLLATNVKDFNTRYVLSVDGRVWTVHGKEVDIPFPVVRLFGDLVLDAQHILYDAHGQYITSDVAEATTDGNEIVVIHQDSTRRLEYIGDNTNKDELLYQILQIQGAQKAVINQGTLLLLANGVLIAAGANKNCECGTDEVPIPIPRRLEFPAPVVDFDFHQRVGWALLTNHVLYVWGYNDSDSLFFLQWTGEHFISPRPLLV